MYDTISLDGIEKARIRMTKAEIQAEQDVCNIIFDAIEHNGAEIKQSYDILSWRGHIFSQTDYIIPGAEFYFTHMLDTFKTSSEKKPHRFSYNFDPRLRQLIQVKKISKDIAVFNITSIDRITRILNTAKQYTKTR